jgi:hypothetical protein
MSDFALLQRCYTGADVAQTETPCLPARLDEDADVDADDFTYFENCLSGPAIPADPDCDP